ncbi:hypothetical protein X777_05565 [Ooceraea biroi]|uniref:Uncharacterized protein n=1 Tax=Ooceraea biroi TaxID=2015173 RepID=A0A026WE05_OOCBI|nr:hypothetical protein X777_05565 [Ooceraea biroi]
MIFFFFYLYPDLCPACLCPYRYHDLCLGPACPVNWSCADDRDHDRGPYHGHDPDPCLCRDPVDLCLDDLDLEIVNENANDVCFSYKREVLQLRRSAQNGKYQCLR